MVRYQGMVGYPPIINNVFPSSLSCSATLLAFHHRFPLLECYWFRKKDEKVVRDHEPRTSNFSPSHMRLHWLTPLLLFFRWRGIFSNWRSLLHATGSHCSLNLAVRCLSLHLPLPMAIPTLRRTSGSVVEELRSSLLALPFRTTTLEFPFLRCSPFEARSISFLYDEHRSRSMQWTT